MDIDFSALDWLSRQVRLHLEEIGFAFFATLLAVYGQDINRSVRARIREYHFILRTLIFIFLCAFGYGWLILVIAPQLAGLLRMAPLRLLPLIIVLLFVTLGVLAERKRKI